MNYDSAQDENQGSLLCQAGTNLQTIFALVAESILALLLGSALLVFLIFLAGYELARRAFSPAAIPPNITMTVILRIASRHDRHPAFGRHVLLIDQIIDYQTLDRIRKIIDSEPLVKEVSKLPGDHTVDECCGFTAFY